MTMETRYMATVGTLGEVRSPVLAAGVRNEAGWGRAEFGREEQELVEAEVRRAGFDALKLAKVDASALG